MMKANTLLLCIMLVLAALSACEGAKCLISVSLCPQQRKCVSFSKFPDGYKCVADCDECKALLK
nr:venom polypeptide precursor [Doratifera vulnerans]